MQPTLFECIGVERPGRTTRRPNPHLTQKMEVYDFFAGAGGFSEGARRAGCDVVWACDNDVAAVKTHAQNHRSTDHVCCDLPMKPRHLPFPRDGRQFHVHFSPPCQRFSSQNTVRRHSGDRADAEALVRWSLETALESGATSWSLEQVPSKHVVRIVEEAKQRHPGRIAWRKVDLSEFGVPQTRVRLIAGPPEVIEGLLRRRAPTRRRRATTTAAAGWSRPNR